MTRLGAALALAAVCAPLALAQPPRPADLPPAQELLAGVILALPDIPLRITGDLTARARPGAPELRKGVEMLLDWHADPPAARYTLRDAFGGAQGHLAVTWAQPNTPEFRYFEGRPLRAAPLPDLVAPIPGTDISWMDLSLSFLWWPDPRTVGREDVRGRSCWVVDVPAPGAFAGCAGVRIWIDPRIHILLKAEAHDAHGAPLRRLEVKSFKKIGGRWVIKDLELTSRPARSKTLLRVRTVEDRTRKIFARPDGAEAPEDGESGGPAAEDVEPVAPVEIPAGEQAGAG